MTPKTFSHGNERKKNGFQTSESLCKFTGKIPSSISLHQYFQEFQTKFSIPFRRLVLLEMWFFGRYLKQSCRSLQYDVNKFKLVLGFCSLVIRTSGGFLLLRILLIGFRATLIFQNFKRLSALERIRQFAYRWWDGILYMSHWFEHFWVIIDLILDQVSHLRK